MADRGVSTAVGYVLLLAIAAVLLSTLTAGVGAHADSRAERATEAGLGVSGERLAADLSTTDRLLQQHPNGTTVNVTTDLPETAHGSRYTISVGGGSDSGEVTTIRLRAVGSDRSVETSVRTTTPVEHTVVQGGSLHLSVGGKPSNDEGRRVLLVDDE